MTVELVFAPVKDLMLRNTLQLAKKNPANIPAKPPGHSIYWFAGMITGQVVGFCIVAFAAPMIGPAALLPALVVAAVIGGLVGATAVPLFAKRPVTEKKKAARDYIFEALARTESKLNEIFVEEEFNNAANNNSSSDSRQMKAKLELKPNTPIMAPPRMGGGNM